MSNLIRKRYRSDVRSGNIAHHLLITFYVQLEISVHIRTSSVLFCARTDNVKGFIVDYSRYPSYFHVSNQSGNALQSSQSEEVFNILKRPTS